MWIWAVDAFLFLYIFLLKRPQKKKMNGPSDLPLSQFKSIENIIFVDDDDNDDVDEIKKKNCEI